MKTSNPTILFNKIKTLQQKKPKETHKNREREKEDLKGVIEAAITA